MFSRSWHTIDITEVLNYWAVDPAVGLRESDVLSLQEKYGVNEITGKEKFSYLRLLLSQFADFIIWVLIAAALVAGIMGEWMDSITIIVIVILNAILGFVQEARAEKALEALKKLAVPMAKVLRDGEVKIIPSRNIIPGDIVLLEAGDLVPADARLYQTFSLEVEEATLTGESVPVPKSPEKLVETEVPLGDRVNMVFMGTTVTYGKGRAVVVTTGMNTELGKIARLIQTVGERETPLQKRLERLGKWLVYAVLGICGMVFLLGVIRGGNLAEMFLTGVSLAVAAIPEGLPAIVTICLAIGVQRMVKRHALIRKLPAVETLGCTSVICSDKTGTITKNEMTVKKIYAHGQLIEVGGVGFQPQGEFRRGEEIIDPGQMEGLRWTLLIAALCNSARLIKNHTYKIIGDPTEGALLVMAAKAGWWQENLLSEYQLREEIPFDSSRKMMTVIYQDRQGKQYALVKGAPSRILELCSYLQENGNIVPLAEEKRKLILHVDEKLAGEALRNLAFAYRILPSGNKNIDPREVEKDLVFVSLVSMMDPPRPEVKDAMEKCRTAGIQTVMITGDHKHTALAVAKILEVLEPNDVAVTGAEIDQMSDEELSNMVKRIRIYARVSAEHKLRIIDAWRKHRSIVAMTGDGVNDAPALKEADIGIAMGIAGTDVSKEASDMILTDDNFASIVAAVEEGRNIYDNIKKFIQYLLSCNTGEVLTMFISSLLGFPTPLRPIQILWINLVTDGLPAMALGVEPAEPDVMRQPPRPVDQAMLGRPQRVLIFAQGVLVAFCTLAAFLISLQWRKMPLEEARVMAFTVLAATQLFHVFNCRSEKKSIFRLGFLTNPYLLLAVGSSILLQLMVTYLSPLQQIFRTYPLSYFDWLIVIGLGSLPLWAMELYKRFRFRKERN